MKKSIFIVLTIALVTGTMSSCYKSSNGKMEGDWTIDGLSTRYETSSGGGSTVYTTTISGSTITNTETSGGVTVTETGDVKEATWKITKDGKWDKKMHTMYTESGGATNTWVTTTSGTWDFLIGTGDDYKKKERVAFYTLNETTTYTYTNGGFSTTTTDTQTFEDGENSMVYVISESKNKSLIMKSEGGGTSSGGTTTSSSEEVTLTQD